MVVGANASALVGVPLRILVIFARGPAAVEAVGLEKRIVHASQQRAISDFGESVMLLHAMGGIFPK